MERRTDTSTPSSVTAVIPIEERTPLVSQWALDQIEIYVMDLVAQLLDHGWEPEALVDLVDDLALRGPHAGQIVTLALVSHAGYWMNDPAMIDLLDEVDELAAGFHHLVGRTVPGWLNRYARDDVEFGAALDGIAAIFQILPGLALLTRGRRRRARLGDGALWADPTRTNPEGAAWHAWCRHRP